MRIDVLTIFPRMFDGVLNESLLGKARLAKKIDIRVHDIREQSDDKHRTVDDRPYGGGPGMVMRAEPIYRTLKKVGGKPFVIYLSPQGKPLTQKLADALSKKKQVALICGHYEGIDERLFEFVDLEVSLGDVVLTGGEIPAMAVIDAVARKRPGVVKEMDSLKWDSFAEGWEGRLDCPHYTRPAEWRGRKVPPELLSGDHAAIARWRAARSEAATKLKRPDLLAIRGAKPRTKK